MILFPIKNLNKKKIFFEHLVVIFQQHWNKKTFKHRVVS